MPVLASAAAATSDDAMLAWAIKHGTAGKRRDIAGSIGVTYPAAAAFLGTTCDRGHGYAGVGRQLREHAGAVERHPRRGRLRGRSGSAREP